MDEPTIQVIHESAKDTRARRIAKGLCAVCGENPLKTKYSCEVCAERQAAYAREHRAKRRADFLANHQGMDGRELRKILAPEPAIKRCRVCQQYLPIETFAIHDRKTGRHATICKECDKKRATDWAKNNPDRRVSIERRRHLKRTYGMTAEEYDKMLEHQGGACAICKTPERETARKRLCVDHCHDSRLVRGLLCAPCNQAIGLLNHDLGILERAMRYLLPK